MPTVDEIMVQLNGAKFFSKIDLSQAYHQLELHKDSRIITCWFIPVQEIKLWY